MPGALSSSAQMMNWSAIANATSLRLTRRQFVLNGSASTTNTRIPRTACNTSMVRPLFLLG
jgi:hypothetical protein